MPIYVAVILGLLVSITCTVLSLIFITPDNKRASLNKFFVFLHDLFNFKYLLLEKILKVLYIFFTLFCIGFGFFGLFSGVSTYNLWTGESSFSSFALEGLLIMIVGPVVIRLSYEGLMMFILIVKNVIQINNKLGTAGTDNEGSAPAQETPAEPEYIFCSRCGTRCEKGTPACPNCKNELK